MLKQQSQIPTCHLCDDGMALDSVTYPDYMTGELMMVHQKCLDETGVTRRMEKVQNYKDGKETSILDEEIVLKIQSQMSQIELLSSLVRPAKVLFAKRLSKQTRELGEFIESIGNNTVVIKLGKWTVTAETWNAYVDAVREMKSSYAVPFDDGENTPMPKDPLEQLATFQQRVKLHKKLFKEASVPYHQNKNATHASHELSQLMSDRLEKEI